jgi:hypothetical protein
MDKETFITRLSEASESAVRLAREFTVNEIAENLIYTIKPNSLDLSDHLTDLEKENLISRKKELNKTMTAIEVVDRLILEYKVPLWINCSVIRTNRKSTVIELFTSRRFRTDVELYNQKENHSPFHAVMQLPPYLQIDSKEKFDVNWRFNKIQTAFKLRKAKVALKAEINKKRETGKDYWFIFDQLCDNLTNRKRVDIAEKLKYAQKYVNGLTDGWYEFKNGLDMVYMADKGDLTSNELIDLEYLRNEINKTLNNR